MHGATVTAPDQQILDQWAPLSHKVPLSGVRAQTLAPTWVPAESQRRLAAYKVLAAYLGNVARWHLPASVTPDEAAERREYGDPALIVDRVKAAVLGEEWTVVVDGADDDIPDRPTIPDPPAEPAEGAPEIERRIFTLATERHEAEITELVDEWEAAWREQPQLQQVQDWLRAWATDEMLAAVITEAEGDICGLGDGVYVLSNSATRRRPTVTVHDPGFYFPVLDSVDANGFPRKVHIAWQLEREVNGASKKFVRRQTWELAPIRPLFDGEGNPTAIPGDTIGQDGRITRLHPWNDEPATETCYFTDATFAYEDLAARTPDDFNLDRAQFAVTDDGNFANGLDLRIDFLPVIHVPNTPAQREHFGTSVLTLVAQILDDIVGADTDVRDAAALAAGPVISLSGERHLEGETQMRPGKVFNVGAKGRMDVLDLSAGLAELRAVRTELLDRLSVNAKVPAEILGRVNVADVASGVLMALGFGPFGQLIGTLRLTRDPKYGLMLKLVQRMAIAGGWLDVDRPVPARIEFGPFLPSDRAGVVAEVTSLLERGAISTETGVRLLTIAGVPIVDAQAEVQRIRLDHPERAKDVADATGSEPLAAEYLGLDLPETGPPEPVL